MIDADKAVNTLLQTAADLADEVRRLRQENQRLRSANRKTLTSKDVRDIRDLYRRGAFNQRRLSEMFDVNPSTISRIVRGHYWKG